MTAAFSSVLVPFSGLILALALGVLIGVERGWSRRSDPAGSRIAGIRTFGVLGLVGGLTGYIWLHHSAGLAVVLTGVAALTLLAGFIGKARAMQDMSATSTIAGIATLAIGILAGFGAVTVASVSAALMTLLLSSRRQLHNWIERLSESEIQAISVFAVISLAVLPLLPDGNYGPFEAWNPRHIWMVVVLVSGLSFAGYLASKWLGESRGVLATSAAGAVVSSTAVTVALASRIQKKDGHEDILVAGIALASAIMFLRVLILTAVLAPFAFSSLVTIIGPPAATGGIYAGWLVWKSRAVPATSASTVTVRNPFDLRPAFALAGLVAALSVLARWLLQEIGETGVAVALAISGMVDVDSAIITMGGLPPEAVPGVTAGLILAMPVMLNTVLKAAIAVMTAGGRNGWRAAVPLILSLFAGLAGLPFVLFS